MNIFVLFIFLKILIFPFFAFSDSIVDHGSYKDWSVYSVSYENGKVCYITSMPIVSLAKSKSGYPYAMVAKFPDGNFELSVSTNKEVKSNSPLFIKVDKGPAVEMKSSRDISRIEGIDLNKSIIYAMRKGLQLTVTNNANYLNFFPNNYNSKEKDKNLIAEKYSLMGINEAYRLADAICDGK